MNISVLDFVEPPARISRAGAAAGVRLRGLRKSFGEREVLHGIDLDVAPGSFVAIVGRSGCGKSTLLRLIAGLDLPTSGTISVDDGGRRAGVRLMFQEPRLLPWAKVAENVEVGLLRSPDRNRQERRARAAEALGQVGLADRGAAWPATLSGGQKQRVALARALVGAPSLLAFDEPLGALDALTRLEMQALIERVWQTQGFTAIVVTHDVSEAVTLADRVILLEDGRVAEDVAIDLPRPRRHGDAQVAAIEGRILDRLLNGRGERIRTSGP